MSREHKYRSISYTPSQPTGLLFNKSILPTDQQNSQQKSKMNSSNADLQTELSSVIIPDNMLDKNVNIEEIIQELPIQELGST
jgi:hypothetical protein